MLTMKPVITLIFLMVLGFSSNQWVGSTEKPHLYVMERVDRSSYSQNHQVTGIFFYEQPHISEAFTGSKQINDYFKQDCHNFFNGTSIFFGENAFQRMKEYFEDGLDQYGETALIEQPFCYYVVTRVTYVSEEYISFCQTYAWSAAGPNDVWNTGLTFNLVTGELVPFTKFYDIGAHELRTSLSESLRLLLSDYPEERQAEIAETYGPKDNNSFLATCDGTSFALDETYFYDGDSIHLTLNYGLYPHNGLVMQWSGTNSVVFIEKSYVYCLSGEGVLYQHIYMIC